MQNNYHILNGDALKAQFPKAIQGKQLVVRECMIDGDLRGKNLDEFYSTRFNFLQKEYGVSKQDYYKKTVTQFKQIQAIPNGSAINLWFEDDLFCQVHFWFAVHLLMQNENNSTIYLIRPNIHTQYGFGGLTAKELTAIYQNKIQLTKRNLIAKLWSAYQHNETNQLLNLAQELKSIYPFILPAVNAHIARLPNEEEQNRPIQTLKAILKELKTDNFSTIYQEFQKREAIYGFGDLQVKRLLQQIKENR